MKKIILSAVMMMAFVGNSFGKSGEVEVKVNEIVSLESQTSTLESPLDACDDLYRAVYILVYDHGGNHDSARSTKITDHITRLMGC